MILLQQPANQCPNCPPDIVYNSVEDRIITAPFMFSVKAKNDYWLPYLAMPGCRYSTNHEMLQNVSLPYQEVMTHIGQVKR